MKVKRKTKDIVNLLAKIGLNKVGKENALDMVKGWQNNKDIDKHKAFRLRKKIEVISK